MFEEKDCMDFIDKVKQLQHVAKSSMHTHSRRYIFSPSKVESEFGLPLTNSRATTPKEKTSAFSVRCPRMAYSGARYPLHHEFHSTSTI